MDAISKFFPLADVTISCVRFAESPTGCITCEKPTATDNGDGTWNVAYKFAVDGNTTSTKAGTSPTNES